MPVIFKHPQLPDYFSRFASVRADSPIDAIPSIAKFYELGSVISLPGLKFDIDHDFWAALPTESFPKLKKLPSSPSQTDFADDAVLSRRLRDAGVPEDLGRRLRREILRLYEQALPIYEALFSEYTFVRRNVVWRLNTIRNENLHIDTYQDDFEDHFARLFINLDNQPRIWMTGFGVEEMFERFVDRIPHEVLATGSPSKVRAALNAAAFGGRSNIWWDQQPRHVAYFDPGDVWAVDSRQIAHQIFYGRRAVSIDFFVDRATMLKPKRHYLALAERQRVKALAARASVTAVAAE